MIKTICTVCLLGWMALQPAFAQQGVSIDLAAIRNTHTGLNGINFSCFNHFAEKFAAGIEINRFPRVHRMEGIELSELSALDIDLNLHYLIPMYGKWSSYPIVGISHTHEKEVIPEHEKMVLEQDFWSFNTGWGVQYNMGRWIPHAEYLFTWGREHQQFLLAGIGFELKRGHAGHSHHPLHPKP